VTQVCYFWLVIVSFGSAVNSVHLIRKQLAVLLGKIEGLCSEGLLVWGGLEHDVMMGSG
jgi:hypothetical protein